MIDTAQDNIINKSKNIVGQNFIGNTLFQISMIARQAHAKTVANALMELLHLHANVILDGPEMFVTKVNITSKKVLFINFVTKY